jgi:hypothetical protein
MRAGAGAVALALAACAPGCFLLTIDESRMPQSDSTARAGASNS